MLYSHFVKKSIPQSFDHVAQAVALRAVRRHVVVAGEAAMLTAQVTGGGRVRFGMSWPGADDRQFALNVLHWLSGAL
ncbi:MAG: hypothetical protein ACJ79S_15980 [Gemmatimonadaceae bacterium]